MSQPTNPRAAAQRKGPTFLDAKNAHPNPDGSPNILRFGGGLDLWVRRPDLKVWRCKVQRNKKRTTLDLGYFPQVSITEARKKRLDVMAGNDPGQERRDAKVEAAIAEATTFRVMAERWVKLVNVKARWTASHKAGVEGRLANHVYPKIGDRPVAEITTENVQDLIAELYEKFPASAVVTKQYVSRVLAFAWANDKVVCNVAEKIKDYLPSRVRGEEKSHAHVRTIEEARRVLAAVEKRARTVAPWTVLAHRLIALTGCRKNEVLGARWEEFDLAGAVWTIPEERMKGKNGARREHYVALAPQAVEVIEAAGRIRKGGFVFAATGGGERGGPQAKTGNVSRCTLNMAMQRALRLDGLDERLMVPHGWRSTFSTIMNEVDDGATFRVVDTMLAHKTFRDSADERDMRKASVERHYNHATYRSKRHEIACRWADMLLEGAPTALALIGLDEAPASAPATAKAPATNVVPLRRRTAA